MNAEQNRFEESRQGTRDWNQWGPYLGERQWGTVREDYSPHGTAWEYFPHEMARSRAYRWGEDGIAGFSDSEQLLCLALAVWNERDPILKERLFGLTGNQGNHGEDVKEAYYYLDATPTHSYLKMLYKYPQREFPYSLLVEENARRGKGDPEFELLDTNAFHDDRYFDVFVEYAKAAPDDMLMLVTVHNRGPEDAPLHVLPHVWFRNTWSWGRVNGEKPSLRRSQDGEHVVATHEKLGTYDMHCDGQPYPDVPLIGALSNGGYDHHPLWYRNFQYEAERQRGLDYVEDLASPGEFHWDLTAGAAVLILRAAHLGDDIPIGEASAVQTFQKLAVAERNRRQKFPSALHRAADAYVVRRGTFQTIIAGYPWFTDWGRDTFIAMRGLCLATGRLDTARDILLAWAGTVSEGMLPNRFPDGDGTPEFNSVDASLWFIVAAYEFLQLAADEKRLSVDDRQTLGSTVDAILAEYTRGTRHGIRSDDDGLLSAGEPGVQLTWMDAKVGDWVVTPRIGKPVEVQALWLNALWIGGQSDSKWNERFENGLVTFADRFWNPERDCLYDVVDVDHQPGTHDASLRPNQIFAVGGLPLQLLDAQRARRVVDTVENRLLTPLGLRSLESDATDYVGHYGGSVRERDGAYHQGTVWPWLIGPFVEAWVRVRGGSDAAKRAAREKFLPPLEAQLQAAGLGHVSEITDGDPPHTPAGCPFQAWSLGELLRLRQNILA